MEIDDRLGTYATDSAKKGATEGLHQHTFHHPKLIDEAQIIIDSGDEEHI